jgi:hypothetical protein
MASLNFFVCTPMLNHMPLWSLKSTSHSIRTSDIGDV